MLCCVEVEHIVDESPFESGTGPRKDGKPGACDFRRTVEIQNAERFAEIQCSCLVRSTRVGLPPSGLALLPASLPIGTEHVEDWGYGDSDRSGSLRRLVFVFDRLDLFATAFMAAMAASAGCFSRFSLATSSDPLLSSERSCSTWLVKVRRCSISVRSLSKGHRYTGPSCS